MNLNIFKGIIPNKSILNKNKWLLLVIVVLVYLGFYWYFKKSQENYYNSGLSRSSWCGLNTSDIWSPSYKTGGIKILDLTSADKYYIKKIFNIRDYVNKISKDNEKLADNMKCIITRKGDSLDTLEEYKKRIIEPTKGVLNTNTRGRGDVFVWGFEKNESRPKKDENGNDIPSCDKMFNSYIQSKELNIQIDLYNSKSRILTYINEIIHEEVIIYLGNSNCAASNDFLNNIWSENGKNLKKIISDEFPGIKYQTEKYLGNDGQTEITKDIVRCEKNPEPSYEDLSATPSIMKCKLAGFYSDPPDDTLVFPLIQYSFLGKTNKMNQNDKYQLYKYNFDPTIKLFTEGALRGEYVPTSTNREDPVWSVEKIIAWINSIRPFGREVFL